MERVVEQELMLEAEQAAAYARADFEAPHTRFIELFAECFPDWPGQGRALDLGCGPGDIAMRFARAYPNCLVDGIDGAPAMLEAGGILRCRYPDAEKRVRLTHARLPHDPPPHDQYDAVFSNSLLHHLHEPRVLWASAIRHARPGAPLFVIDLMRPSTREEALLLTSNNVGGEPEILRLDFFNSLMASFTLEEVKCQLQAVGLDHLTTVAISDRHLMVHGTRP